MIDANAGGWASDDLHRNAAAATCSDGPGPVNARIAEIAAEAITGVDCQTGLASDFLNQFNEITMLLEVAQSDADLLDCLHSWRPRGYIEHFETSHLRDSALVIEAYRLCPAAIRLRFDRMSHALSSSILCGLAELRALTGDDNADAAKRAGRALAATIRERVDSLSALIHPTERAPSNAEISELFVHYR